MPTPPRKGESKDKFISRCISYIVKKEGKPQKQAVAICHNMWRNKKMSENEDNEEYQEFTLEFPMTKNPVIVTVEESDMKKTTTHSPNEGDVRAVGVIGDRFYQGKFLPAKELEKVYKSWERTLHDINHMGTTHLMGLGVTSDIRFFVGYQKNVTYDLETKKVSMDIHVNDGTLYAEAWRGYVNLCEEAGKIPNVSIAFLGKVGTMKAKDLPKGVNYSEYGLKENDIIEYIYDIRPQALSTVLKGACNDKDGCGIKSCKTDKNILSDEDYEKRRQELIKKLIEEENKDE